MAKARAIAVIVVLALLFSAISAVPVMAAAPGTPANVSPANGTTDIGLTHTFLASAFVDGDGNDTQYACQWQGRAG